MAKYVLKIRKVDSKFLDLIRSGQKTIETRAAIKKYQKIKVSDVLRFVCGKKSIEKKVLEIQHFKTINVLLKNLDLKKIMPHVSSPDQAKKIWFSFPNCKEKIQKYGLLAFKLGDK